MIAEYLSVGADNPTTGRELAYIFNCNIREIASQIEKERRQGQPICANMSGKTAGYYLAADSKELQLYCDRLQHRAAALNTTKRALLKLLDNEQPQHDI